MPNATPEPRSPSALMARLSNHLRQVVYGGNDGIVTTFAIVAGFAGAGAEGTAQIGALAVLVFGLANLFADGVSMGLGEFLSARSEADLQAARRGRALRAMAQGPDTLTRSLSDLLRRRGLPPRDAEVAAQLLAQSPALAEELVLRHAHDLPEVSTRLPALDGLVTFVSFLVFGIVPLLPFLLPLPDAARLGWSITGTFAALAALGLLRGQATGDRPLRCLIETLAVGGICALVAYGVGWAVAG